MCHAEASHKTPATEPPAKKAKKSASTKAPATAPVSCRALAAADENTPAPGKSARRPAMDPATEAKKLRELCVLLRAELAAQRTKVASSSLDCGVLSQSPTVCSLSFPNWLLTWRSFQKLMQRCRWAETSLIVPISES